MSFPRTTTLIRNHPPLLVLTVALACAICAAFAPVAGASQFIERNAQSVQLAVDAQGDALVSFVPKGGSAKKYVFLSGKQIGALPPTKGGVQAHWDTKGIYLNPYKSQALINGFRNACKPYTGPALPFLVASCTAPDGSYWALQNWQTPLPDLGFTPWKADQAQFWLDASHWRGDPAKLEVWQDWVYGGRYRNLFGRYTYAGKPVYGFGTTAFGAPTDQFGRLIYVDTYSSLYGADWRRENSFVPHNPTGLFCYGFYQFDPSKGGYEQPPGYAGGLRGPGVGSQYRLIAVGPGVTPDVAWQAPALHAFRNGNVDDLAYQAQMSTQLASILNGDRLCGAGHDLSGVGGEQAGPGAGGSSQPPASGNACATDTTFIATAYRVLLGRDATATEQTYWKSVLNGATGATLRFKMTSQLATGDEARQAAIQGLYHQLLGRAPTQAELTKMLALPTTVAVTAALVSSPEYAPGAAVDAWADKLGADLLGGALDPTLKAQLVSVGTAQGRAAAAAAFLQSVQYRQQVVRAQFQHVLGRTPNPGELASYVPAAAPTSGPRVDPQSYVAADLASSAEYLKKTLAACSAK